MFPRTDAVIELAHDLVAIGPDDVRAAALLGALLPADEIIWARVDLLAGTAIVRGATAEVDAARASGIARHGHTHQGLRSYEEFPGDRSPRRISDVASQQQWHSAALYQEVYREFGPAHQLGLLTGMTPPGVGTGWTLTRSGSDFTEGEMDLAHRILPVLVMLETMRAAPPGMVLKPRETVLLAHLAAGLTARAIGRRMGITERTVRKHLGDLYSELGCRDRLMAVQRARELGLLPQQAADRR